jgi:Protein of unknown function (DUF4089)
MSDFPSTALDDEKLADWLQAAALLLALPAEQGDRGVILTNLRFIAAQIAFLNAFPLEDKVEPANVFRA